ncbi:SapC family protein [Asticcacaulis solisilvae]|uniref:SapC family protein n=1 Tax=Asticcacaulis solisilvae TaxID=1217274 RepID=UPI003FD82237
MNKIVVLNNVDHHDVRLKRLRGAGNGETVNQVRVFPPEFRDLQREYPIFFRRDDNGYHAVAILGLDPHENLYLEGEGETARWEARYVPAILERGPFSIGLGDGGQSHMIMVDLDHPWVGRKDGEPLFLDHGGNAPGLDQAAATLRTLHAGVEVEQAMFAAFEQAGLIAYLDLDIRLDESTEYKLPELYTIRTDTLRTLDGTTLASLNASGFLDLAIHVVSSHDNLNRLIEMKNRRRVVL